MNTVLHVLPDVETLVIECLKADGTLAQLIRPENISGDLPPKSTVPWITVSLTGGNVPVERRLIGASVQIDAWGGKREQARKLAAVAHAVLVEMRGLQPSGAVVTGVGTLLAPRKMSGRQTIPPTGAPVPDRPRYVFECRVYARPNP